MISPSNRNGFSLIFLMFPNVSVIFNQKWVLELQISNAICIPNEISKRHNSNRFTSYFLTFTKKIGNIHVFSTQNFFIVDARKFQHGVYPP